MKGTIQKLVGPAARMLLVLVFSSTLSLAQTGNQQSANNLNQTEQEREAQNIRLDEFLDLTQEQRDQIRELNRKMQPQIQLANRRVQLAQRALDQAIYGDEADEALIEQRVRELTAAQSEQASLRAKREFQFRKVLTSEQIQKFLTWRQQVMRQQQRLRQQLRRIQQNRRLQNPNNFPLRNKIRRNNRQY